MAKNVDIRLQVGWFDNLKVRKLRARHGFEGVVCLLLLWEYAAMNAPSGCLGKLTSEEIALLCRYADFRQASAHVYGDTLLEFGLLERGAEELVWIHDWEENQPYIMKRLAMSKAGKKGAAKRWGKNDMAQGADIDRVDANPICPPNSPPNTPNPTQPNPTQPTQPIQRRKKESNEPDGSGWMAEILNAWHKLAKAKGYAGAERVPSLTAKRRKNLAARPNSWRWSALEAIGRLLRKGKPFLAGENDRGWKADIGWFLKPDTVAEILEGKWDEVAPTGEKKRKTLREHLRDDYETAREVAEELRRESEAKHGE